MKARLENTVAKLWKKSDTAAAIRYALSRWRPLMRYADGGTLEIDNNAAERELRVVALGRENSSSPAPMPEENMPPPCTRC